MKGAAYFIWLSLLFSAGSPNPKKIYQAFNGNALRAYRASYDDYIATGLTPAIAKKLANKDFTKVNSIIDYCVNNNITLLTYSSMNYPQRLFDIPNPPPILYCRGNVEKLTENPSVTIIGSRKCTQSAYKNAYSMSFKLAASGINVITGLASGIDTAANLGAVDANGFTVGVLGCGINKIYPKENEKLFNTLYKSGLVMTEFPPHAAPSPRNFPIRNRILAALGEATLVVEANSGSGAILTANMANNMMRTVFAVPGDISNEMCSGSNQLLKAYAKPAITTADVVQYFERLYPITITTKKVPEIREEVLKNELWENKNLNPKRKTTTSTRKSIGSKKVLKQTPPLEENAVYKNDDNLSPEEKQIYHFITKEGKTSGQISSGVSIPMRQVLSALTMLEIYGYIESCPGGLFKLL